ncbi:hypothetical protein GC173_17915 [bacterium]|nr:hypothetical protein [bacterium]
MMSATSEQPLREGRATLCERAKSAFSHEGMIVLWLVIAKAVLMLIASFSELRSLFFDEAIRYTMTYGWLQKPYFAPGDHLWLGGFFAIGGVWLKIFGFSPSAAKAMAVFFALIAVPANYSFARRLTGSIPLGVLGALLVNVSHVHTWLSMSFMADIVGISFLSLGFAWFLAGYQDEKRWLMLLGALSIGLSCSQRYESWLVVGGFSLIMGLMVLARRFSLLNAVLCGALAWSYIAAWLLSGWLRSGNPFLFLETAKTANEQVAGNPFVAMAGFCHGADPWIYPLALAGMALGLIFGSWRIRLYAIGTAAFVVVFIWTQKVGTALTPWRIIQTMRLTLVPFIPVLVLVLWPLMARLKFTRILAVAVVSAGLLVYTGSEIRKSIDAAMMQHATVDTLAVAEFLRGEDNVATVIKRPEGRRVRYHFLTDENTRDIEGSVVSFLLGEPRMKIGPNVYGKIDVVIGRAAPPAGYAEAARVGTYRIYTKTAGGEVRHQLDGVSSVRIPVGQLLAGRYLESGFEGWAEDWGEHTPVWILGDQGTISIPARVFADLGPSGRYDVTLKLYNSGPKASNEANQTAQLSWNGRPLDASPREVPIGFSEMTWSIDAPEVLQQGADLTLTLSTCHIPGGGDTRCIAGGIEGLTITRYEPAVR